MNDIAVRDSSAIRPMPELSLERTCRQCGAMFMARRSQIDKGGGNHCSQRCNGLNKRIPLAERFWKYVLRSDAPDDCWLWIGHKNNRGYGMLTTGYAVKQDRTMTLAHRIGYQIQVGAVPDNLHVLHHCDNPPCVRGSHLFLGSQTDNMRDMASKHRAAFQQHPESAPRGSHNGSAKLNESDVQQIRQNYATKGATQALLARQFNVDASLIGLIVRGRIWTHVL